MGTSQLWWLPTKSSNHQMENWKTNSIHAVSLRTYVTTTINITINTSTLQWVTVMITVMRKRKFNPNTLHWLPVRQKIEFKLGILAFKCLHGDAPSYLTESLSKVAVNPALQAHRSATRDDLVVPQTRTVKMGPLSFCVSGPMLWNSLPLEIRYHEQTLESFKAKLKTFLFKKAYFSWLSK